MENTFAPSLEVNQCATPFSKNGNVGIASTCAMTNSPTIAQPIPTIITQRKRNYSVNGKSYTNLVNIKLNRFLPIERAHSNKQINDICDIPSILTANVRAIGNKIDEIQQVAELNSVGAICVTETWLAPTIPDSNITIPGFNLFRKDRIDTLGGGVCIYLKSTIPCKYLEYCDQIGVESIWLSMRPHKLPRPITSIILAVVYHSTRNCQPENIILRDHIQKYLDLILSKQPNALVIITGDFNPTSTGFKCKDIAQVNNLRQLVKFKTILELEILELLIGSLRTDQSCSNWYNCQKLDPLTIFQYYLSL